jgi:hypothetical protein
MRCYSIESTSGTQADFKPEGLLRSLKNVATGEQVYVISSV